MIPRLDRVPRPMIGRDARLHLGTRTRAMSCPGTGDNCMQVVAICPLGFIHARAAHGGDNQSIARTEPAFSAKAQKVKAIDIRDA